MVHHLKPFDSLAGGKVIEMNKQEQLNVIKEILLIHKKYYWQLVMKHVKLFC